MASRRWKKPSILRNYVKSKSKKRASKASTTAFSLALSSTPSKPSDEDAQMMVDYDEPVDGGYSADAEGSFSDLDDTEGPR